MPMSTIRTYASACKSIRLRVRGLRCFEMALRVLPVVQRRWYRITCERMEVRVIKCRSLLLSCGLAVLVVPMLLHGQKVKVDYDKGVDFTRFKTYMWGELYPARLPMLRLNIIGAIDEQLAAKGLVQVKKNADLVVTYAGDMAGESNQAVSAPAYPGYAGQPPATDSTMWTGSGGAKGGGSSVTYPKGSLVVELMDPHASKITWRAVGRVKLDIEKKSQSLTRVNDTIAKMFAQYPPGKTGKK